MNSIKVILLGESGVGKTSLINVSIGQQFNPEITSTLNTTYFEQKLEYNDKKYAYCLWDTAGQEVYRALNKIFMKGAKIIMLVYSIDSKKSFEELNYWIGNVKETLGDGNYIMAIIANKADKFEEEEVSDKEGKEFAKKHNAKYCVTSALNNAKEFKAFLEELVKEYIISVEQSGQPEVELNNIILKPKKTKKGKKCCSK